MKKAIVILLLLLCTATTVFATVSASPIFLVGEQHGIKAIYKKEQELWTDYYKEGHRILFTELPYYTAAFLNEWMRSDDDSILDELYADWEHTAIHTLDTIEYYKWFKEHTPDTIFIGTDVGHQGNTTGSRYLALLEMRGLKDSTEYALAKENIEQGKRYYARNDSTYREKAMAENFIREYSKIEGEKIMGIYGAAHTSTTRSGDIKCPTMTSQIIGKFGPVVKTEDLSELAKENRVLYETTITVKGKEYKAFCYGESDISFIKGYKTRTFYKIENAFDDFCHYRTKNNFLPYNNYPCSVKEGEVFLVVYNMANGKTKREYQLSNNFIWNGQPTTKELVVK
jgi:hypothetical protein